ncbi:hypothetical protein ABZ461_36470 [Actinacidiphila glaucinigra]|uniref:hypothetical protein n=1 Tax=Actinacidiphila glaucinigra TaxID=235986 RepID=UPI0033EBF230
MVLTALAIHRPAPGFFLFAVAVAGAGPVFGAAVAQTAAAAAPASGAGVLAVFLVIAHLGMGLPSMASSLVIRHAALVPHHDRPRRRPVGRHGPRRRHLPAWSGGHPPTARTRPPDPGWASGGLTPPREVASLRG